LRGQPLAFPAQLFALAAQGTPLFFGRGGHAHHTHGPEVAPQVTIQIQGQFAGIGLVGHHPFMLGIELLRMHDKSADSKGSKLPVQVKTAGPCFIDHKYLVGQFVTATIDMPPEENTLEIPTTAINEYNGQSFVFVKDKNKPGEYCIRRVAVVGRYADYTVIRSKLRDQDKKFSADEVKQGRYPLRTLERGDQVVTRGVVELTTALENLLTKKSIELQQ